MPEPSRSTPPLGRRLTVAAAGLVVMAAAGVSLIVGAQGSSGEPVAGPVAALPDAAPPSTVVTLPPPPALTGQPPPAPTEQPSPASTGPPPTTTTTPTTTTAARAAAATKTSPPRLRPANTPAPAAARPPAPDAGTQQKQVESLADSSRWDWRKVHVQFRIGFAPGACCHWGVYDPNDHKTIWIGPTAFGDATRLRYVVLHELAHAWQWHSHRLKKLSA
ncbi:MAG: hypothetical protein QOF96_3147, partial [Actinomycetota bacterium]|nr:hypothetical protein [Actinomycetota bacterium]